ncbi:MAG: hypothetical protein K0R18_415 [Bacillales bacterium]|jgi:hypothetical protein|nr:hypothetical protein [Bacillales bacterium]
MKITFSGKVEMVHNMCVFCEKRAIVVINLDLCLVCTTKCQIECKSLRAEGAEVDFEEYIENKKLANMLGSC